MQIHNNYDMVWTGIMERMEAASIMEHWPGGQN